MKALFGFFRTRKAFKITSIILISLMNLYWLNILLWSTTYKPPITKHSSSVSTADVEEPDENGVDGFHHLKLRMKDRLSSLKRKCELTHKKMPLDFDGLKQNEWPWIYVSHKYKLLYCEIPKAGSSNWLKLFSVLNGIYNGTRSLSNNAVHYLPQVLLSHLTKSERVHALRTYTKFLVVREPMERALSAFRDKLERKPEFGGPMFRYLASKIVEKYRSPDSSFSISRTLSKVPRFDEFVEFVTDPNNTQLMLHYSEPRHWQPQSDLCYPCNIDYDYVLHMENIKYEADFMFRAEGLPSNVKYPPQTENEAILGLRKYDILMSRYYSSVRRQHIDALIRYYEKDYSLFGYTVPSIFYS